MNALNMARPVTLAGVALLAAGVVATAQAQSAPAPTFKVGDRWVYNVKSGVGINPMTYQETREVTAVGGGGAKIKVTGKTVDGKDFTRVDEWSGPARFAMAHPAPMRPTVFRHRCSGWRFRWAPASDPPSGST
jgi:hypothetical protein